MFYAAQYAYGRVAVNHGGRADMLRAFQTIPDRDRWVDQRTTDYIDAGGYRETLTLRQARWLFGDRAIREAREHGEAQTHICTVLCR